MKKGYLILVAVIFLLGLSLDSAAGGYFSVKSSIIDNRIMINEEARFNLTIENSMGYEESFRIYYSDVEWGFSTSPRTATTVIIPDKSQKTVEVVLKPLYVGYGTHGVTINVRAVNSDKLVRHSVLVSVISLGQWSPGKPIAVGTDISMPREINPKEPLHIKVQLENQYAINVTNLVFKGESTFFKVEELLNLKPLEKKTLEFNVVLDPMTSPKKDIVLFTLTSEGQVFKEVEREIEVVPYADLVRMDSPPVKKTLGTRRMIVVTNKGNANLVQKIKAEAPPLSRLYVFMRPGAKVEFDNSKKYFVWELALEPGDSITIVITESYAPLIIFTSTVLLIVILYFVFRSPVIVRKEARKIKIEEGGLSQIKVMLNVKNRTRTRIKNVRVLDRIPNLADIIKTFKIGSLKPVKILKHERKGSIAKWFIDELEPYEERIIVYDIKARLTILGGFELPSAFVKFRGKGANERIVSSNRFFIKV